MQWCSFMCTLWHLLSWVKIEKETLGVLPVHDSEEIFYPFLEQLCSYSCLPSMSVLNVLYFKFGKFFHTLNTIWAAGRIKKIKIKKLEIYEKCGMEGISVHGNCGGEEIKRFFFVWCLCIIWLLVTLSCATNKSLWCRLSLVTEFRFVTAIYRY